MQRDDPVCVRVIERVAEREGVDPVEMRPLLYDVIDPDYVDGFTSETTDTPGDAERKLTFTYRGYLVTVEKSGRIDVTETGVDAAGETALATD